jgi:beta-glucosidase
MMHGGSNNSYGFYNAPIPRLGISALTMADGPMGVRIAHPDVNGQRATQLPSGQRLWLRRAARRWRFHETAIYFIPLAESVRPPSRQR